MVCFSSNWCFYFSFLSGMQNSLIRRFEKSHIRLRPITCEWAHPLLTFQETVESCHLVILAHTCNKERGQQSFSAPFYSCPKTKKTHRMACMQEIERLLPLWITLKPPQPLSQAPLSLPLSFVDWKENTCLSPKATFSGVPCMIGNLLRMLLPSGRGCLELLNYCDVPLGWAKKCIPKSDLEPRKIPWHFS